MANDDDDQMKLIETDHPLAKKLKNAASAYKEAQRERMQALAKEIDQTRRSRQQKAGA